MTYYYEKDFLLKKGYLSLKKVGFIGIKKYLLLCAPVSITDVAVVYENLFSLDGNYKIESKAIPFLGHIAFAALKGTPLLIILSSEKNISNPTFVNFADVKSVSDETKLRSACCMALCTNKTDYKFTASSSVEYQLWIQAFEEAYKISRNALPSLNCTPSLINGLVGTTVSSENPNFMTYTAEDINNNITNLNNANEIVNTNPFRSSFVAPNTTAAPLGSILTNSNFPSARNSLIILSNEKEANSMKNNGELIQSPHVSKASLRISNSHNNSVVNFPFKNKSSTSLANEPQPQPQQPQQQPTTLGRLFTNAPKRIESQNYILKDLKEQEVVDEDDGSNLDTVDDTEAIESSMMTESSLEPSECFNSYRNFNNSITHNSSRIYDYSYSNDIRPNESMINKEHNESFNAVYNNSAINYGNDVRSSNSIKNNSVILQMPPGTPTQHKITNDYNMMNVHDSRGQHVANPNNHTTESDVEDVIDESNFETTTETESISEYDTSYNAFPATQNTYAPINSRSSVRSFNNMSQIIDNNNNNSHHMRTRSNQSFHYTPTPIKQ